MSTTFINTDIRKKIPHWEELEQLSKDDKITLIAVLSTSILEKNPPQPSNRTWEMVQRCCGSWVGEQSAEEIIGNINKSKLSKAEPVNFE